MTCVVPLLACRRHVSWTRVTRRDVACRPDVSDPTDPTTARKQQTRGTMEADEDFKKVPSKAWEDGGNSVECPTARRAAPVTY